MSDDNLNAKKAAGQKAAEFIQNGMLVGLGTGSTAALFVEALAKRCQEGLNISAVATSHATKQLAHHLNIPLRDPETITSPDITVDGADEIDPHKSMIKGGGGALFREKLLASSSKEMIVIVDENKLVNELGGHPVPVEIPPFLYQNIIQRIENNGYHGTLRKTRENKPFVTDNGNYIFDIQFTGPIKDPITEHNSLKAISGVIETGFFFNIAGRVIIGYKDGSIKIRN